MKYKVFISFKKTDEKGQVTADCRFAAELYAFLRREGIEDVFFSEETIQADGNSGFTEEINKALDSSEIFIYVCSKPEYLETSFVKAEYSTYINEMYSGRKPPQSVFGLLGEGVRIADLNIALRQYETFPMNESGMRAILAFIKNRYKNNGKIDLKEIQHIGSNWFIRDELAETINFFINDGGRILLVSNPINSGFNDTAYMLASENSNMALFFNTMSLKEAIEKTDIDFGCAIILNVNAEEFTIIEKIVNDIKINVVAGLDNSLNIPAKQFADNTTNATLIEIEYPNNNEIEKIIDRYADRKEITVRPEVKKRLEFLLYGAMRNSATLAFLLSNLNSAKDVEAINSEINVYRYIDHYLYTFHKDAYGYLDYIINEIYATGINSVIISDQNKSAYLSTLIYYGIIQKKLNIYKVSSSGYLLYKIAFYALCNHGIAAYEDLDTKFKKAHPYFSFLIYEQTEDEAYINYKQFSIDDKVKLIQLFEANNKVTDFLIKQDDMRDAYIAYCKMCERNGQLKRAERICGILSRQKLSEKQLDLIRALQISLQYKIDGTIPCFTVENKGKNETMALADIAYCTDNYKVALEIYNKLAELCKGEENEIDILLKYAELLFDYGDKDKLRTVLMRLEEKDLSDKERAELLLVQFDSAFADNDMYLAEKIAIETYKLAYKNFDVKQIERASGNLGTYYLERGNVEKAIKYVATNLKVAEETEDLNGLAIAYQSLAKCEFCMGNYKSACMHFSMSAYYAKNSGNNWRLNYSNLWLELFSTQPIDYKLHEEKLRQIESVEYMSRGYLLMGFNAIVRSEGKSIILDMFQKAVESAKRAKSINDEIIATKFFNTMAREEETECSGFIKRLRSIDFSMSSLALPMYKFNNITTDRLYLRHVMASDVAAIFEYASTDIATRYVIFEQHKYIQDSYKYIEDISNQEKQGVLFCWAIVYKENERVIGTIDICYNEKYGMMELGYIINHKYWHRGIATEAVNSVLNFLNNEHIVNKICAICFEENTASAKVLQKTGFLLEKVLPNYHNKEKIDNKNGLLFIKEL